jgi:hypothetical protein
MPTDYLIPPPGVAALTVRGSNYAHTLGIIAVTSAADVAAALKVGAVPCGSLIGAPVNIYAASGAINLADNIALIVPQANCGMTLAAGTVDGKPIKIKKIGSFTVTVTGNIDGVASNTLTITVPIELMWSSRLQTWLQIQ